MAVDYKRLAVALPDPVRFGREILRHNYWSGQEEILRSATTYPRTLVLSANSIGKTFVAADLVLWFITRWPQSIALTTAPGERQVASLLWKQIAATIAQPDIGFTYPSPQVSRLVLGPNNWAMGFSAGDEEVKWGGFHAPHVLIIGDEATGLSEEFFSGLTGIMAGGNVTVVLLANPIGGPAGPIYDFATTQRAGWHVIKLSAFDSPNLRGPHPLTLEDLEALPAGIQESDRPDLFDYCPFPQLTRRYWCYQMLKDHGCDSPLFRPRVLAEFASADQSSIIDLEWCETVNRRPLPVVRSGRMIAGIDVAGSTGGDETVVALRDDGELVLLKGWRQSDPRGHIVKELMPYRDHLEAVRVDVIGIGYHLATHLSDCGFSVEPVNVSHAAANRDRFASKRAEIAWALRERLKAGDFFGRLDDLTIGQLCSLRWWPDGRGRIVLESKEEARKRGIRSPDRFDAIALAYMTGSGPRELYEYYRRGQTGQAHVLVIDRMKPAEPVQETANEILASTSRAQVEQLAKAGALPDAALSRFRRAPMRPPGASPEPPSGNPVIDAYLRSRAKYGLD